MLDSVPGRGTARHTSTAMSSVRSSMCPQPHSNLALSMVVSRLMLHAAGNQLGLRHESTLSVLEDL